MSKENTIPQNNLPIYLQNYTIFVLGNLTSLDCSVSPKDEVGTIEYSTLGVIPSNKKDARVWDLKASGTLKPHDKDYIIHYDLSKVDYDGKVTFENQLSGVITVCGRVISISKKNATWLPCEDTKTVSIILDQSRWGFSITKDTPFSLDIQLDDDDTISFDITVASSADGIYTLTLDGNQATLNIKSTNTFSTYQIKGNNKNGLTVEFNGDFPTIELYDYYTNNYSSATGYINFYRNYTIPGQFSYTGGENEGKPGFLSLPDFPEATYTDFYIQGLSGEQINYEILSLKAGKIVALNGSGTDIRDNYSFVSSTIRLNLGYSQTGTQWENTFSEDTSTLTINNPDISLIKVTRNNAYGLILKSQNATQPLVDFDNYATGYTPPVAFINYYRNYNIPNQFILDRTPSPPSLTFYGTNYNTYIVQGLIGESLDLSVSGDIIWPDGKNQPCVRKTNASGGNITYAWGAC